MQFLLLAAESHSGTSQLVEAFKQNPTFLVLNLCCSAIVLTIVVERLAFQLTQYRVNSKEFFAQVKKLVAAGNIDRAIKLCEASDYPILQLVKAGLTHANKGPDEIDAALSEKLVRAQATGRKARRRAVVARQHRDADRAARHRQRSDPHVRGDRRIPGLNQADKQRMLSNGIAEAMYNTALGLGIAVFCMITHIILHTRAKTIQHDLEATMERTFNLLTIAQRP